MRYAQDTSVSAEKSRSEIERTLQRYGADQFMYGWEGGGAIVGFRLAGRVVRLVLPMPSPGEHRFTHTPERGLRRPEAAARAAWEQATRQSWRALALVIKAKLEAVEAGISTFEREFLADTVLPNGQSVADWLEPQIEKAIASKSMPTSLALALPAGGS